MPVLTMFDYDKALAAVAANPFAKGWLEANRSRLEELGLEVGQAMLLNIVDLFAAGKNREAWAAFYGPSASWTTLGQGAAEDVTNTAAMAQRWKDFGDFLRQGGLLAAKALLAILVAGFCG